MADAAPLTGNPNASIIASGFGNTSTALPAKTPTPVTPTVTPVNTDQGNQLLSTSSLKQNPPVEPTVLTSSNITDTTIPQNLQTLSQYQKPGQVVGQEGIVRNADASFAEAPSNAIQSPDGTWSYGGLTYGLGPSNGNITSDPATQALYDQFTSLKSQMDATGAQNIQNVKDTYQSLIDQQTRANAGQEASVNALLLRGGSEKTASSAGIYNAQVSYGLQQISDLNAKENAAVIAAQQASENNDYQLLDKQLSIAQQARTEKQAAASKLNDTLLAARQKQQDQMDQQNKDSAIQSVLSSGVTDPGEILKQLKDAGNTTISADDISKTLANLNPDQKEIHQMMLAAAQNGAPQSVLSAIGSSKNLGDAISATGKYATDPTSLSGQFQAAVAAGYNGTPGDWVSAQKYKDAYNAEAAKQAFTGGDANQQKLEQEGRAVILKELSNRSGGLGIQDAKVNQAIHLKALFDQYATTDAQGNTVYNIPTAQYAEVAMGLANLVSPGGQTSDSDRQAILSKTAGSNLNAAIQYITGTPQPGNTQAMIQNLVDSVNRQGTVAEQERQIYIDNLSALLPTDLSADRQAALLSGSQLNSFINPQSNSLLKAPPEQIDAQAKSAITKFGLTSPDNATLLESLQERFPQLGATDIAKRLNLLPQ